jgi:hypothetical protein
MSQRETADLRGGSLCSYLSVFGLLKFQTCEAEAAVIPSHFQKAVFCHRSVNTFPSSRVISHFVPTLLLHEVMLRDEEGHRQEGVIGHWDHPVGIVLLRRAGNWLVDEVCRERRGDGEPHVMKMCVFL